MPHIIYLRTKSPIPVTIHESLAELKKLAANYRNYIFKNALIALICIKTSKYKTRQELANYLGVHKHTQERWPNRYTTWGNDITFIR